MRARRVTGEGMATPLDQLLTDIRACTVCADLPLGPRPVLRAAPEARVVLIGQAPEIDGRLLINDGHELVTSFPQIVRVEVNDAHPYDVVGGVVA